MSNTNTNPVVYDVAPEDENPVLPEVQETPETEQQPQKKNVAARIFAAILAAISVAIVFLPIKVLKGTALEGVSLFNAVKDLFAADGASKLFGVLPTYANIDTFFGKVAGVAFYVLPLMLVLAIVFGVIAVFCGKKAPALLRVTAYFFTLGFGVYAITTLYVSYLNNGFAVADLDYITLGLTLVGAIVYFVTAATKVGKVAWVNALQFVLSLVSVAAVLFAYAKNQTALADGLASIGLNDAEMILSVVLGVFFLDLIIAGIRVQAKKGLTVDLIRYIVQLLIAAAFCYIAIAGKAGTTYLVCVIAAAVVSLIQLIICIIQLKLLNKKEEPAEEPEPVVEEYVREEYAEALPYEGGPVEGVAMAEEVTPTFTEPAPAPQVQTAGYDFYNSKSFDPFIALLSSEERNQFTELFILKYKGPMPEIPDYQVGGDNKEFFRKLFIYLGQYRDRIPDNLLSKIYQFAIKM